MMGCVKDAVAETLEQLWISYNSIEKLKGLAVLKKLKVKNVKRGPAMFRMCLLDIFIFKSF